MIELKRFAFFSAVEKNIFILLSNDQKSETRLVFSEFSMLVAYRLRFVREEKGVGGIKRKSSRPLTSSHHSIHLLQPPRFPHESPLSFLFPLPMSLTFIPVLLFTGFDSRNINP